MDGVWDVVVVGAGPAGLASAIFAAQAGHRALLVAPGAAVQDKACGEGLMPAGVAALTRLQVSLQPGDAVPLVGVRYHAGAVQAAARLHGLGADADADADAGGAVGLSRQRLSALLHARAEALGVPWQHSKLTHLVQHADHVAVTLADDTRLRARHLIGADGLHSRVRQLAGLQGAPPAWAWASPSRRARYGLRRHVACAPWSPFIEVYLGRDAEAYVTPVAPDCVNVAFLTGSPKRPWAALVADVPALAARLAGHAHGPVRGAGPFAQRSRVRAEGRVALVGDAAGYVDAVTGEGVSLALLSAEACVRALATADPAGRYVAAMRRPYAHYARHATALLWLLRLRALRPWALRLLAAWPRLMRAWLRHASQLPRPDVG